jgi:hypothetical protein
MGFAVAPWERLAAVERRRQGGRKGAPAALLQGASAMDRSSAGAGPREGEGAPALACVKEPAASCALAMEEKLLLAAVWEEAEGCGGCKRIGVGVKNGQGQGKGSIFIDAC